MSGTFSDAGAELYRVYHKRVLVVPPHKKRIREDLKGPVLHDGKGESKTRYPLQHADDP